MSATDTHRAITAAEAEEYTQSLGQILGGGWRQVEWAQRVGIPTALGMSTREWVEKRLGGYVKLNMVARRQALVEPELKELSTRQVSDILGVSHETIAEDRRSSVNNLTPEQHPVRSERDGKAEANRIDRADRELAVTHVPDPDIRHGSVSEALTDVIDVDLVFTDPPYPREFLPCWTELAVWAAGALRPGALVVAYSGQYHLPEVLERLSEHLTYQWLGWIHTTGPQVAVHQRPIMSGGKPLLIFSRGTLVEPYRSRRFYDAIRSEGRTRELHTWQQGEAPAAYYIETLTERGELVVDPFLGSGTFAFVAQKLGRRFIGCDVDAAAVATSRQRLRA